MEGKLTTACNVSDCCTEFFCQYLSTECLFGVCCFFFFQAEDGIRDLTVTGVQTCALPIFMDFGRFKYEQSKKDREAKKHQVKTQLREVRMKPKIDEHDIDFKTRTAAKLLKQGDKVKVTVMFRGREITHPQIGKNLLDRVVDRLSDISSVEKDAMLEGRHMSLILILDKKKVAAKARADAAAAADAAGGVPPEEEEDEALLAAVAAAPVVDEDGQADEDDDDDDADDVEDEADAEGVTAANKE